MDLAGIRLNDALVLELALMLRRSGHGTTADRLEAAVASYLPTVRLTPDEQVAILEVLDDPPPELEQLRDALGATLSPNDGVAPS